MISSNPAFINLLSLSEIPHFTTVEKFSERIGKGIIAFVFNQVLKFFTESLGNRMIIDSTQLTTIHIITIKGWMILERGLRKKYVKTTICVDDKSQLIVSYSIRFGYVHDSREFKKILKSMNKAISSG